MDVIFIAINLQSRLCGKVPHLFGIEGLSEISRGEPGNTAYFNSLGNISVIMGANFDKIILKQRPIFRVTAPQIYRFIMQASNFEKFFCELT